MNLVDPQIVRAINGENDEARKAGTRPCLMNRRQFLLTGGIATTYIFPCLFILKVDPRVSRGEAALCKVIIAISCVFSVVCLVNTVIDILQKWQDVGPPFMCMSCDYKKANHLTPGVC